MSIRSLPNQNLQNYPKIHIEPGSVIKSCVSNHTNADPFIDKPTATWKRVGFDLWHEGLPFILRYLSNLKVPPNTRLYYAHFIKIIRYIALFMLHIHRVYLCIYGYFYPYSLMPLDEVCNQFSRCPNWTESVIRAFAWHPNHDRCAVAICNDYIYVYERASKIRTLRHNHQRKILDLAWQPNDRELLAVATQTCIILWRISENSNGPLAITEASHQPNLAYLAPSIQLMRRDKFIGKNEPNSNISDSNDSALNSTGPSNFKLLENVLAPPIVHIEFDKSGNRLYACSPNSSKIAIVHLDILFAKEASIPRENSPKRAKSIEYIWKFGQGVTRISWSPQKNRLATATTSSFFRVFEPTKWSCNKWLIPQGKLIQDMVWSRPTGRMLLIANKDDASLYTLPFLDEPQAGDVGGNKSLLKALDLTATQGEHGDLVGGRVQSFAWDKEGKRLAISFKDNPESILLYRTVEKPTMEFHQLGLIRSESGSIPLVMEFHDKFRNGSLLTICWSDGNCQHIPLSYSAQENARTGSARANGLDSSFNSSVGSLNGTNGSPRTLRSLTNFCLVSGNNSISSYRSSLMPINKVQHQTTLFSLSDRSHLTTRNESISSDE